MKQQSDILDRLGRRSGMTVPEGYFESFAADMMSRLPEREPVNTAAALSPSLWQRVRPYAYLAAMFCGVWLMMWIFNDVSTRAAGGDMFDNPVFASVIGSDSFYDNYLASEVDTYDLTERMYEQGFSLANLSI